MTARRGEQFVFFQRDSHKRFLDHGFSHVSPRLRGPLQSRDFRFMFGSPNRQQNMQGTAMVLLGREELDVWLGEPQDFILAVLRDIYEREEDVLLWLNSPLPDQRGQVAVDLLSAGRTADVEAILVDQWNER